MNTEHLKEVFLSRFGLSEEPLRVFHAPGRVNMIGEHTDYNGGCVFPAAVEMGTTIIARKRSDQKIIMEATDLPQRVEVEPGSIDSYRTLPWGNYQAGVACELMADGHRLTGCEMLFDDTLPHGGGLSSSAAIEVSTAMCLMTFANEAAGVGEAIDKTYLALIGQRAERNYIGVSCGIMDQFASAMGKKDCAILLDCATLSYRHVPLTLKDKRIVIANTNKKRSLITSKYNERCAECAEAVSNLKTVYPAIQNLGELSPAQFEHAKAVIKNETVRKRATHVVYECARVMESVEKLTEGDIAAFASLMNDSHDSLRDLYEVTGKELDTLVNAARSVPGCLGSRMTGAGFGGCSVSIVQSDAVDLFRETVSRRYTDTIGYAPSFYVTGAADGVREIK